MRNIENIELILNIACLFGRHLSVSVSCGNLLTTNTAYLVGFRGRRKLTGICGKFATVSCGIWQSGPQNLEKFAAENCGP